MASCRRYGINLFNRCGYYTHGDSAIEDEGEKHILWDGVSTSIFASECHIASHIYLV